MGVYLKFLKLFLVLMVGVFFLLGCKPTPTDEDTTAPVIVLNGKSTQSVILNKSYTELGATAVDEVDGEVTVKISGKVNVKKVGTYTITYVAKDKAGNEAKVTRKVKVVLPPDTTKPVITLNGKNPMELTQGTAYTELGATATDDRDGTVSVTVSGSVDVNKVGTYTIFYTATDKAGHESIEKRIVNIVLPTSNEEPITVVDSTKETISHTEIKTLLENNETTYTKSFTLDDKKTKVKLSFDLLENNVTKDVKLELNQFELKEDIIFATMIELLSNIDLVNVEINFSDIEKKNNKPFTHYKSSKSNSQNISIEANIPEYITKSSNFDNILKTYQLKQSNKQYSFEMTLNKKISNLRYKFGKFKTLVNGHEEDRNILNSKDISLFLKLNKNYLLTFYFDKKITNPFSDSMHYKRTSKIPVKQFKFTTDFIGLNQEYTVAEKNLGETRAHTDNILNNFMDTAEIATEKNRKPFLLSATVTHRITDFDKLLTNTTTIPSKWRNSNYGKNILKDNGRMPLILVHGWNGDKGMRDPSKLLLWENAEFHYWHNFLAFYLTSEELQKKYHVYFYRYTSYKHVAYNAKIFKELLTKVSSNTDLGKGFQKDKDGVTIMAHSMGGMVSRAMIEEFEGLGKDAKKLKKLITLDTPHHGSIGSMDNLLTNFPKDLDTHGAMDLNYDNFDNVFNAKFFEDKFNSRRSTNGLDSFDEKYCKKLYPKKSFQSCMNTTANPYMKYINDEFVKNKDTYNKKYIFYTAWNIGFLGLTSNESNFISNGAFDVSTKLINWYGYSAGGAETVGSSLLASNNSSRLFNPKQTDIPVYEKIVNNELYHKDISVETKCLEYDGYAGTNCAKWEYEDISIITNSIGKDHPYGVPYRLFWDYDHETIFNGTAKGRGEWDEYINNSSSFSTDTNKYTQFKNHRADYIKGAMKIRYGQEPTDVANLNPLTYEPVFLVIEKDLLTSVTNDDIDEDGMKDTWEIENGLRFVNASDANEDSDDDGLTNIEEYNNGLNSTDPQNPDSDGDGFKDGAEVTAGTNPNDKEDYPNIPPTANAGANQTIKEGESVTLDASGSSDVDGDDLTYIWTWKSDVDDSILEKEAKSFEVAELSVGEHIFTLTVKDSKGAVDSDEVNITVTANTTVTTTPFIKKTGQTIAYAKYDDGFYEKGVTPNYTKESDGILDRTTGLVWQDDSNTNGTKKTWSEAKNYCDGLTGSWRLPIRIELSGLVRYDKYNASIDDIFAHTTADYYWTQSISKRDAKSVWAVSFSEGVESTVAKTNKYTVRCVKEKALVANAGADQIVKEKEKVNLVGSYSPNKDNITHYKWSENGKKLGDGEKLSLDTLRGGVHTITLTVTDKNNNIATDTMSVTIISNHNVTKKTGQNISYAKFDDGYYEKGIALNYVQDGENILDRATGLVWQDSDETNSNKKTWQEAKEYCATLENGNWRLPTRKELSGLVRYDNYNPSSDRIFAHTASDYYWSLDTNKRDATKAWLVSFSEGVESAISKDSSYYTRCVQSNFVPTANAGADQFVQKGQGVTLRATQSPREELIKNYVWFEGDNELGQGAELVLEADEIRDGEHNITLVITDQNDNEYRDNLIVTIVSDNRVVKKTGQNISYAKFDDGYYEKGIALNYSKKEDNILDRATGLLWQDSEDTKSSKKTWQEAKNYCALRDGHWRLPTRKELSGLVRYDNYNPSTDKIFAYTASDYYWTVDTSIRNNKNAWAVSFSEGVESAISKDSSYYARCVQTTFVPTANAGEDIFVEKGHSVVHLSASNSPRKNLIDSYLWENREGELGYEENKTLDNFLSGRQNIFLTITDKEGRTDTDDLWVTIVANGKIVKKTGQTESYADYDDGYYQKGRSLSYSDHGNTVTDDTTGLEWKDDETTDSVKMTWEKANEYCSQGNNVWRLPTRRELSSLVNYSKYNPSIDDSFDNTASDYYWTIDSSIRDRSKAWAISFSEGVETTVSKSSSYFVRCLNAN